jgi:GNAT superfamily N-acetyltransferase
LRIRAATASDVGALASLVEDYWIFECIDGFDRPRIESLLRSLIAEPALGACWVAEADGGLCGYLLTVFVLSLEHAGMMAEIDEFFVSGDARSAGVGSGLVSCAERDLAERGMVRLQLQLGVDNPRARPFYERHGFRRRAGYELFDKPLRAT